MLLIMSKELVISFPTAHCYLLLSPITNLSILFPQELSSVKESKEHIILKRVKKLLFLEGQLTNILKADVRLDISV